MTKLHHDGRAIRVHHSSVSSHDVGMVERLQQSTLIAEVDVFAILLESSGEQLEGVGRSPVETLVHLRAVARAHHNFVVFSWGQGAGINLLHRNGSWGNED